MNTEIEKAIQEYKEANMRLLNIGETIKKGDEVNIQPFGHHNGLWKPIWEKVTCHIGWKVTECSYGKYRREIESEILHKRAEENLRMSKRLEGRERPNLDEVEYGTPHWKED